MANLYDRGLSPVFIDSKMEDYFSVQLHLTSFCDLKCKHCYMYDESFSGIDSDWAQLCLFFKKLEQKCQKEKKRCFIGLTGGDPILSKNFWKAINYLNEHKQYFDYVIMGNSFHINKETALMLKDRGVKAYQLSLDGLEKTHDLNRKEGTFKDVIRCLGTLHEVGITTCVMFTVSKTNYQDFIPLMHYLDKLGTVDVISFDKMIMEGNAKVREDVLSSEEYRDFLYSVLLELVTNDFRLKFSFKDNMWKLLFCELGLVNPYIDENNVIAGCLVCSEMITVLPDGTIQSCRRMNDEIGNIDTLDDFTGIKKTVYQHRNNYQKCNECDLWAFCRGCLAARKIQDNQIVLEDPYCWKE